MILSCLIKGEEKMRKRSFKEKFSYWFDSVMAKGTISMIGLLFGITLLVAGIMGIISAIVAGGSVGEQIWVSLMHTIDAGTIAGDSLDNIPFIVLMVIATLCGLFITSILIGIITTGFENKLDELKKGTSTVLEEGHTVILGFNDELFVLLNSLIEANSNHKNQCIVVVGDMDIAEMEDAIASRISDFKTTKVICRSGKLYEEHILARAGVENSNAVIVNCEEDTLTVKVLLALAAYIGDKELLNPELSVTAVIREEKYVHAAKMAGGERAEIVYAKDAISRIIAHTCNQGGICRALTELFDYDGDELYFENVPGLAGKKFSEVLHMFEKQVVFGIFNQSGCHMNPPMDTVLTDKDQLILLEEDDGVFVVSDKAFSIDESAIADGTYKETKGSNLLILGQNSELDNILAEYDNYVPAGTKIIVADTSEELTQELSAYTNIQTEYIPVEEFDLDTMKMLLRKVPENVLILLDEDMDSEEADSEALLKLIEIRTVKEELNLKVAVTSEIRNSSNQKLASLIGSDDFVVGSNIVSLMTAQISQNRNLAVLFEDILDADGSEIYMKPALLYVKAGVAVDFHTITEAAIRRGEIAVGYKRVDPKTGEQTIVTNPEKSEKLAYTENDSFIVIAED